MGLSPYVRRFVLLLVGLGMVPLITGRHYGSAHSAPGKAPAFILSPGRVNSGRENSMERGYSSSLLRMTGFFQGGFYVLTGLWSLVSISTFQMVTGPKTDLWLVKTVGVLVIVSGLVFIFSAARRYFPPETIVLAIGNALGLAVIEIIHVSAGRISPIYLLDAVLEILLACIWVIGIRRSE